MLATGSQNRRGRFLVFLLQDFGKRKLHCFVLTPRHPRSWFLDTVEVCRKKLAKDNEFKHKQTPQKLSLH